MYIKTKFICKITCWIHQQINVLIFESHFKKINFAENTYNVLKNCEEKNQTKTAIFESAEYQDKGCYLLKYGILYYVVWEYLYM